LLLRFQAPLREFIRRRLTDNGRLAIDAAVVKLLDDNLESLEEMAAVAHARDDIDLVETLHKFLEEKLLELAKCILEATEEQVTRSRSFVKLEENWKKF
jgi:hypothetical protein